MSSCPTRDEPSPTLRGNVTAADRDAVRSVVEATGFFRPDEVLVAIELVDEYLAKGDSSGYGFLFAEVDGRVAGYVCYGPIACTLGSYDLYWIAVDPRFQGQGVGQLLLREAERRIVQQGGRHIYIETSGRHQSAPTRAFYDRSGYGIAATLPDFYDQGDDKVIWRKICLPLG